MGYTTEELAEKSLEAIAEHDLVFINEVCVFIPCSEKTFFNHKLHELQPIKDALNSNKVSKKIKIRDEWETNGNSTERVALYKLLGTTDERDALNGTHRPQEADTDKIEFDIVDSLYDDR